MKTTLALLLVITGFSAIAQNTKIIFDQYYVDKSDFDGNYVSYYDLKDEKNAYNANEAFETYVVNYENGQIAELGQIQDQKPVGVWKKWDENGKLLSRIKYKDGHKSGKIVIRDEQGKIIAKGRYNRLGKRAGNWYCWSVQDKTYTKRSYFKNNTD